MKPETAEALVDFMSLLAEELETEDRTALEIMNEDVLTDGAFQAAIVAVVKRAYQILSPFIDADRMGVLVNRAKLDPDFFDTYIA